MTLGGKVRIYAADLLGSVIAHYAVHLGYEILFSFDYYAFRIMSN